MEAEIILQNLDLYLISKSGPVIVEAEKLKLILKRYKALEMAFTDLLRLNHAKTSRRAYKRVKTAV